MPVRGLFVYFADFGRVLVAREAFVHGQRRMADDELARIRNKEIGFVFQTFNLLPRATLKAITSAPVATRPSQRNGQVVSADGAEKLSFAEIAQKAGRVKFPSVTTRMDQIANDGYQLYPSQNRTGSGGGGG